jgi:hypothetical protein
MGCHHLCRVFSAINDRETSLFAHEKSTLDPTISVAVAAHHCLLVRMISCAVSHSHRGQTHAYGFVQCLYSNPSSDGGLARRLLIILHLIIYFLAARYPGFHCPLQSRYTRVHRPRSHPGSGRIRRQGRRRLVRGGDVVHHAVRKVPLRKTRRQSIAPRSTDAGGVAADHQRGLRDSGCSENFRFRQRLAAQGDRQRSPSEIDPGASHAASLVSDGVATGKFAVQ